MYVVDRDFGFAPNPFHGTCTLATCKPKIRGKAKAGDWVIGMGGARMKSTGRCIFAMRVARALSFNEYWSNPEFLDKKPVRNGSSRMMLGDNIYSYDPITQTWHQADSHHSNPDGSANTDNVQKDTQADRVLISEHFFYFGAAAPLVPANLLQAIGFKNGRSHRVYNMAQSRSLMEWLHKEFAADLNTVKADPYHFDESEKRYSGKGSKVL